jgi:hypothetical protein
LLGREKTLDIDAGLSEDRAQRAFRLSPGWFGIVVYRFNAGLNQIS